MRRAEERDFEAFVAARGPALLRLARLLVSDAHEAEDVLQTALLRLTGHWGRRVQDPEAYTRRVLVNLAKDRGRRRLPWPFAPESLPPGRVPDHADAAATRDELTAALATLPPRQRVCVVLRHVEGLSEAETAGLLGCSVGTVKSQTSRGLARLRDILGPGPAAPTSANAGS
ncbi:SigE family RNA polymerase sigma factor [Motilibacter aurantiacus]|uniref:SigE family RNA polymerase sigma factor n=1 Tax=Motilibacter aurantiacus TaxID=2714955 RepID=UPI0014081F80|nr:SigE family RNA polymerase sigma factor [Motilibacter aurantiacus]